jgi:hypothetical protein
MIIASKIPTFSPATEQSMRIENEFAFLTGAITAQADPRLAKLHDPREYRLSRKMFVGDGLGDVF